MKTPAQLFWLTCFLVLGAIGIVQHELWLDEAHHYLLARDSNSLSELVYNARYEGHPLLWNYLLYLMCFLFKSVLAMQILHLSIAALNAFLILRYSPFSNIQKILLTFSYFIFYEYSIISRNYALSLLFLLLCLIIYTRPKRNYALLLICLGALANTHLFSLFTVCFFFCLLAMDWKEGKIDYKNRKIAFAFFFFLLAIVAAVIQIKVPSNHFLFQFDSDKLLSMKRIGKALSICWKGLFHFQDPTLYNCWNTNWLVNYSKKLASIIALFAWVFAYLVLKNNRQSLFLFYGSAFLIVLFVYLSPIIVAVRHCGFLFLLLLSAYWLKRYQNNSTDKIAQFSFTAMLLPLVLASLRFYLHDFNYPFSTGKDAALFIESYSQKEELPVLSQNTSMPVYSAYSGKKPIEINTLQPASFCNWNNFPFVMHQADFISHATHYLKANKMHAALLLCQDPLDSIRSTAGTSLVLLQSFQTAIVKPECYSVYRIELKDSIRP